MRSWECDATTISINKGMAASMAGVVAMAADKQMSAPVAAYLFHRPYRMVGTQKVLAGKDSMSYIQTQKLMESRVFPYLTKEEIETYNSGGDVVIDGEELVGRINNARA